MSDKELVEIKKRLSELESKIGKSKPKTVEKKKRKPSAYILFVQENLPKIREEFPGLAQTEYMKMCGNMWKESKDN
jgi:hypothetical protein